jgi:ubiquinone/menaquinone biosynthesis C-methylase UbiE
MNKKLVQEQFGANAEKYVTSKVHAEGDSLARLVTVVQPQAAWQMLDVATGAGHTALAFAPYVQSVIATDITPEMLQQTAVLATKRAVTNLTTETADAEELPYAAARFDLITCRIAPHHFPHIGRFVAEATRVLQPGGLLAVVDNVVPAGAVGDYVNAFEKLRDPSHGRCLSLAEWMALYTEAGLSIEHTELLTKRMEFDWWARRMTQEEAVVEELAQMLQTAVGEAHTFLQPTTNPITFQLTEALIVGRKQH